jgi:two-component system OmpR family response regulator
LIAPYRSPTLYRGGVTAILLIGVDRPGLSAALRRAGPGQEDVAGPPVAALIRAGESAPVCPALIEAPDVATAIRLLDTVDDVVLASDPDALVAARLAALVRRTTTPRLHVGDLAIDPVTRQVTRAGAAVALVPREYGLLLHLARHAGEAVSRAILLEQVWGLGFDPGTNVVEVHVSRLRAKLRHAGAPILFTDKGVGYRLGPSR